MSVFKITDNVRAYDQLLWLCVGLCGNWLYALLPVCGWIVREPVAIFKKTFLSEGINQFNH